MTQRRIVFPPDSFKGSITAVDAAAALAEGWREVRPGDECVLRPMADGGEGTLAAFEAAVPGARRMPVVVDGPAGVPVSTCWLLLPGTAETSEKTAVIDVASTSGIELLEELRPWQAGSDGTGQAVSAALDHGVSRVIVGIGSSASTDGGLGLLRSLGATFADAEGHPVETGAAGLIAVDDVDLSGLRPAADVRVLTDVTNPLTGPNGAAAVFGPQKGLSAPEDVAAVDEALAAFAERIGVDPTTPGAGAAGGLGAALLAWGATLVPGAAEVAALIGLGAAVASADVVVTGEGSYDGQSGAGKVPSFVAALGDAAQTRVLLAAGRIAAAADIGSFAASASLTELAGSAEAAQADAARWLRAAGAQLAREFDRLDR